MDANKLNLNSLTNSQLIEIINRHLETFRILKEKARKIAEEATIAETYLKQSDVQLTKIFNPEDMLKIVQKEKDCISRTFNSAKG